MRIFFALWPPAETARALADWAQTAQRLTGGKPTDAAKIHLTLAFLGDADPQRAVRAARRVRAAQHSLALEHARHWRENHIVWAGPRETPPALARCNARASASSYWNVLRIERSMSPVFAPCFRMSR